MGLKDGVETWAIPIGGGVVVRRRGALRKYFSHGVVARVYRVDRTGHIGYPAGSDHPGSVGNLIQVFGIGGATDERHVTVWGASLGRDGVAAEQTQDENDKQQREGQDSSRHDVTSGVCTGSCCALGKSTCGAQPS